MKPRNDTFMHKRRERFEEKREAWAYQAFVDRMRERDQAIRDLQARKDWIAGFHWFKRG